MGHTPRIELLCGKNTGIPKAERMYERARQVAEKFGIQTYFDNVWDSGDEFVDGYVYPRANNMIEVLDALDKAKVEYDNIDIPIRLAGSKLARYLQARYPRGFGVEINFMDY